MTITKNGAGQVRTKSQVISNYIVATANDTTSPVDGLWIDNGDGLIEEIFASVRVTDQTGTSPTLTMDLEGSNDGGTTPFIIQDSGGSNITTGALDISMASTTAVQGIIQTTAEGLDNFPGSVRLNVTIGGTSTPGGTYTITFTAIRRNKASCD